ncbi:MAG: hypothetical protein LBI18_04925 [Planctomycetaceae bacterium]|nr:hypothetical protein [Planctomycetaceae bacterium]
MAQKNCSSETQIMTINYSYYIYSYYGLTEPYWRLISVPNGILTTKIPSSHEHNQNDFDIHFCVFIFEE